MKTIKDFDLNSKKVLIRCDFNVPIKEGKIIDNNRIVQSLETIKYALDNNAKVILFSHLGRVKEESDLTKNNLEIVSKELSALLEKDVFFSSVTRGEELEQKVNTLKDKEVLLVQNTRYEDLDGKKESKNDEELGKYWASLGDLFINDAFGTAHRAHASNVGIASHLPCGVGFLIKKELDNLELLNDPKQPFVVILGGAKVADKIGVINNLVDKASAILIGGGMSFTFLKAKGLEIGKSLLDEESIDFCKEMLEKYPDKIVLPIDAVVSPEFSESSPNRTIPVEELAQDELGLDIGPQTVALFAEKLTEASTIVWNGPLGVYEFKTYAEGTNKVLEYITNLDATTILAGGDVVAALSQTKMQDKITHASTGGGATLEFIEGKELPGIQIIKERS